MEPVYLLFIVMFGACAGSFLNVVIYRLPRGQSIVFPGSHCPSCGRAIRWYDNIPLLSWLVLKGRCRRCGCAISPRYLIVEAVTAALAGGLYVCYYWLRIRDGVGAFSDSWPTFVAHGCLLAGLLVCAIIDIEHWVVPLEACWTVSVIGLAAAAFYPPSAEMLPRVTPAAGAAALGALVGLGVALVLQRVGLLRQSFIDADDKPVMQRGSRGAEKITAVAVTKDHGVRPRLEVLRELLFLAPAIALGAGAYLLVSGIAPVGEAWESLSRAGRPAGGPFAGVQLAARFSACQAALVGYVVGGAWIWGIRILGTLGFGKEAMGLGDVHILAAVGAVCGWITPSLVFFLAPVFALLWALYLFAARRQRELPYGPWLAAAALAVMLFYDGLVELIGPYLAIHG